ncbi:electron transfer flavoprotein-ubiquinone oxidoreductase [Phaeovibrio sulfidiphilus]|uniref:Electron transfer flavoprotein-ubiquinone oxidoreductase n=1 Tax=Phaeovibrio sulfidiphilus TaxID=1220600 RepID=A0A8J6YQM7_9PROT|nr:electron transfer flavoprotein-ubiquinone oxidoreductase [Phaeovibrio sulfidiphilus]MBE1237946.1 electron transfer flavoprotein-ubiquinone oxidoreductase [Phaeovibrio sulfidiphilus]
MSERESMDFDVVVVGGGPSGLATAIRLRQLAEEQGRDISVCVLEKGASIGSHTLSGAVVEPRGLADLFPDWKERGAPLNTPVTKDVFYFMTRKRALRLMVPPALKNKGNHVASLGALCRWLGEQAEALGVDVFPGFAVTEALYDEHGAVRGVATGAMGVSRDGTRGPNFEPGVEINAKVVVLAEGCRGSLTRTLTERFDLRKDCGPGTYGIGIKEIWEIDPAKAHPGRVMHSIGWPLPRDVYGGSFLYHLQDNKVSIGLVIGLDYANPWLSPFNEFQQFKTHPAIRALLEGGRCVSYGARALVEGGLQALPRLTFPGGLIVGDSAGFMNVAKIKGSHTAIKSGVVAAEAIFTHLAEGRTGEVLGYPEALRKSWLWAELKAVRNIRPSFHFGFWTGLTLAGLESHVFHGRLPYTLKHSKGDNEKLVPAAKAKKIEYPAPDGRLTFDRLTQVYLSNTAHEEDQPCHLRLTDPSIPLSLNLATYAGPEARYCPAGVYEYVQDAGSDALRFQINAQNCVHCKTCDIKDPAQNIVWSPPQGGDGPNYVDM